MNKFARRASLDEEKRIIIEEVSNLMGMGYREKDNEQIMEGMQVAIEGCSDHEDAAMNGPLRVGIGGPVGSGKTMLCLRLCQKLRERYSMAVVTNDIYCSEDAQFLIKHSALAPERIAGVETGGCPHTAIREDCSLNLAAVDTMREKFPNLDLILIESAFEIGVKCCVWERLLDKFNRFEHLGCTFSASTVAG